MLNIYWCNYCQDNKNIIAHLQNTEMSRNFYWYYNLMFTCYKIYRCNFENKKVKYKTAW